MSKEILSFPNLSSFGIATDNLKSLSKPWQKFFIRLVEIDSKPINKWNEYHILSYFLRKYYEAYQIPYALTYAGAPLSCTEIKLLKKVYTLLSTTDQRKVKAYIDWMFEDIVSKKKFQIKGITVLLGNSFANEFLRFYKKQNSITKQTELPDEYKNLADECGLTIDTYGSLLFVMNALKNTTDPNEDFMPESKQFIQKLKMHSFDFDVLKGL
jgi:hypothetical protein